jgi:hypothetical protein
LPVREIASLLREDPDLANNMPPDEIEAARRVLLARVELLHPGPWSPAEVVARVEPPAIGLLVIDGLVTRELFLAGRPSTELLGASDVLRPWDQDGANGPMPIEVEWRVMTPTRLAVLDRQFMLAACRFPAVVDALMSRTLRRARWLAFQVGIKQITRVDGRLLVLLWALSERWGVVTPHGVQLRIRLTHEALARLVGARRPSVTTALGALTASGQIERRPDGFLLLGDADQALRRAAA